MIRNDLRCILVPRWHLSKRKKRHLQGSSEGEHRLQFLVAFKYLKDYT